MTTLAEVFDENGRRRAQGGFATKSEARTFADAKAEKVAALRRGDRAIVAAGRCRRWAVRP